MRYILIALIVLLLGCGISEEEQAIKSVQARMAFDAKDEHIVGLVEIWEEGDWDVFWDDTLVYGPPHWAVSCLIIRKGEIWVVFWDVYDDHTDYAGMFPLK